MASDKIQNLTDSTFDKEIKEGIVLVDFWAVWCGPCLALGPTIDELAETYEGRVKVCKLDVDSNQGVPTRFGIRGIPTVILFKNGEQIDVITGNSPQNIKEMVLRALEG